MAAAHKNGFSIVAVTKDQEKGCWNFGADGEKSAQHLAIISKLNTSDVGGQTRCYGSQRREKVRLKSDGRGVRN